MATRHTHGPVTASWPTRSARVVAVAVGTPWAAASAATSVPVGVPNSCSKRSPPRTVAWGRNEKIPPPSLSTTTTRRSTSRRSSETRAFESCTKARSPTRTNSVPPCSRARPSAVDTTPSIPFAPRLQWHAARDPPNHSKSRTGMDDDTVTFDPTGRPSARIRATAGSVSAPADSSVERIAASARASASIHACRHAVPAGSSGASASSSSIRRTAVTFRAGSIRPGPPTWTRTTSGRADHWARTFELAGRPIRTITSAA